MNLLKQASVNWVAHSFEDGLDYTDFGQSIWCRQFFFSFLQAEVLHLSVSLLKINVGMGCSPRNVMRLGAVVRVRDELEKVAFCFLQMQLT